MDFAHNFFSRLLTPSDSGLGLLPMVRLVGHAKILKTFVAIIVGDYRKFTVSGDCASLFVRNPSPLLV